MPVIPRWIFDVENWFIAGGHSQPALLSSAVNLLVPSPKHSSTFVQLLFSRDRPTVHGMPQWLPA